MKKNDTWYGAKKYRYDIYRNGNRVYFCVSTNKYQDDVVDILVKRFTDESSYIRIDCNGKTIGKINPLKSSKNAF